MSRFEIYFLSSFLPQLHLPKDVEGHVEDHVDHHDGQEVAGDSWLMLIHEEYCHHDVDLKMVENDKYLNRLL